MSVDPETLAVYDAKASEYDDIFFAGQAGAHLKRFMDMVTPGGAVFDLGCGPGNAAVLMQEAGFKMTCVDASAAMIDKAKARGLDAQHAIFDEITGDAIYNGVWANFSLLHAPRAEYPRHFAALSQAMAPGAAFHIGMKAGTGEKRDGLGRLYTFVTVDEVCELMQSVGITPLHKFEFTEVGMAGTNDPCMVIQGLKNA